MEDSCNGETIENALPVNRESSLADMVRGFERDALGNRRLIRSLLERDRHGFYASVIQILRRHEVSRATQYLISLLVSQNLLVAALCDPQMTAKQALALARAARDADPQIDVAIAKALAADAESAAGLERAQRLMEILSQISGGTRILPWLMRLLRHSNPYLRSKAVLLVGRGSRSVAWVRKRLSESDVRVRANAVEALWGVDTQEARELLRSAMRDGNNRVVGNSLLSLYRLGDCSVIPELLEMGRHSSAAYRVTAAWAIGETGDPRFLEALARMLNDPSAATRRRVFAALGRLKTAAAEARRASECRLLVRVQGSALQKGWRQVQLEAASSEGRLLTLLPTQIVILEEGRQVTQYRMEERIAPETVALAFVIPRGPADLAAQCNRGALACLAWKRAADLWARAPYVVETGPASAEEDGTPPPEFTASAEHLAAQFRPFASRFECTGMWSAIRRSVETEGGPARGKRHLIVIHPGEAAEPADYEELVASVLNGRASVHAVSLGPNPILEDLCRRTMGEFRLVTSVEKVAAAIEQAHLALTARYSIAYLAVAPEAGAIRVRVQTPLFRGEAEADIP